MRKKMGVLIYAGCFFILFKVIYRLSFFYPVKKGEKGYGQYRAFSAALAGFVAGMTVIQLAALEVLSGLLFGTDGNETKNQKNYQILDNNNDI